MHMRGLDLRSKRLLDYMYIIVGKLYRKTLERRKILWKMEQD